MADMTDEIFDFLKKKAINNEFNMQNDVPRCTWPCNECICSSYDQCYIIAVLFKERCIKEKILPQYFI